MAKKKIAKGAGARDADSMSKTQVRDYHKEICEFYVANGWRTTLSQYLLSPTQAGEITKKVRARMDKETAKAKAAKVKARAAKKGAKAKASTSKKKAPPKAAKLKEKASKKAAKVKKKPAKVKKKPAAKPDASAKKPTAKKPTVKKVAKRKATKPSAGSEFIDLGVLDFLLGYRENADGDTPLDTVIADLTARVRIAQRSA